MITYLIHTFCFCLVAVASFAVWAFGGTRWFDSTASLYTACAIVFFVLGGLALLPFSGTDEKRVKFRILWLFPVSFLLFAICWCLGWFLLRGHFGELVGSAAGIIAMTAVLKKGLHFAGSVLVAGAVVFLWYTLGYYVGERVYREIGGLTGKLGWGAGFGAGMGAGLSYLIQLAAKSKN